MGPSLYRCALPAPADRPGVGNGRSATIRESWMAGLKRDRIRRAGLAALMLSAVMAVLAQGPSAAPPAPGTLSGKLTDLRSAPLGGVTVILRNQATGAEARTTTGRNGSYRFAGIEPGSYSLEAESGEKGRGRVEDIEVPSGHETRVQAAMSFEPFPVPAPGSVSPVLKSATVSSPPEIAPFSPTAAPVVLPRPDLSAAKSIRLAAAEISDQLPPGPLASLHLEPRPLTGPGLDSAMVRMPVPAMNLSAAIFAIRGAAAAMRFSLPRLDSAEESAQAAEPDSAAVTTNVSGEQLHELPASGRHWEDFLLDTPGAAAGSGSGQVAVRGAGHDPADTTIDGASVRLAFGGAAGSGSEQSAGDATGTETTNRGGNGRSWSGRGFLVSESAVRSVRIVAGNVEADGAHAAGGRAGVETESGTNQLHGQAFLFDRQNTWSARNPFTQWTQNTGTADNPSFTSAPFTPPDREFAWGFGAGSRIRRDRLFWFAALDGYRRNDPGVASAKNPEEIFALLEPTTPQIVVLSAQLGESPNQAYSDYLGVPRAGLAPAGLEQLAGLLGPAPRTASQWTGFARLDWQAAERHRFTLEGSGANWNAPGGGFTRVSESFGNHSFGSSHATREWLMARWEAFLTPNLLAVTQASAGRSVMSARPGTPSNFEKAFLGANSYGQLPQIVVDSRYGFTIGNPSRFGSGSYPDEHLYHGQELLEWVHGKLLLKAGGEFDHNTDAVTLLRNRTGTYSYAKVENFIADALAFQKFGLYNLFNFQNPHNCGVKSNSLGAMPCYSYFTQTIGPDFWQIGTNDFAGFATAQWQLNKVMVFSAGLRWEREQLPPPMKLLDNPDLPLTQRLPGLGDQWGPRMSLAIGDRRHWPVVRLGYGIYYGRTENATLLSAITQTGSLKGDLSFFIRPTDGLNHATETSAAPPFPSVLNGRPANVVTPGAVEYAPNFRNSEIHQAVAEVEKDLPSHLMLSIGAMMSLGRRLPISIDTNYNQAANPGTVMYNVVDKTGKGPIKSPQIKVPFYAMWPAGACPAGALLNVSGQCGRQLPNYQQVTEIFSRANSTYEAAVVRLSRNSQRGLSFHAYYTYAHAMDWNPNGTTLVAGSDVLDPEDFSQEYGTGNLDVRHSAAALVIYQTPWKLGHTAGRLFNGWLLSGIGQFHSGLPYSMRTTGAIPKELDTWGDPTIIGIGPGMNGSGGDNRVYGVGRNTYRYPETWKADVRLGKKIDLGEQRQLELLAESFNLFNHRNVTGIHTTGYSMESGTVGSLPTLNFLTVGTTGTDATTPAFGQPLNVNGTNFYRERQIQLGARLRF